MEQQQGIRRRFSQILTSSIGICRSKEAAESPICVYKEPASTLQSLVQKPRPRLADLFSADSDTTRCCEKFESDKTSSWSETEADRASMSHLSPFEYETCKDDDEAPPIDSHTSNSRGLHLQVESQEDDDVDKRTSFQSDYYYKPRSSHSKPARDYFTSDSDIASSVLVELSLSRQFQESSVCSNEPDIHIKNDAASIGKCKSKPTRNRGRRARRSRKRSEVVMNKGVGSCSVAVAKRSVDPYEDFKRSMVEMIVEKEIFGREELEELLLSFLGLNSPDHHKIIVLVFVDILQILFSNSSK